MSAHLRTALFYGRVLVIVRNSNLVDAVEGVKYTGCMRPVMKRNLQANICWAHSMFQSIFTVIVLGAAVSAIGQISFGGWDVASPAGWQEVKRTTNTLTLRSSNSKEQALITTMSFATEATFDDFKRICQKRIEAEKRELSDGFVDPSEPFKEGSLFGMMFSGGDKKSGRVFSGYLSYTKQELVTLYVEGVGVSPTNHLATFKQFVRGLKRR